MTCPWCEGKSLIGGKCGECHGTGELPDYEDMDEESKASVDRCRAEKEANG